MKIAKPFLQKEKKKKTSVLSIITKITLTIKGEKAPSSLQAPEIIVADIHILRAHMQSLTAATSKVNHNNTTNWPL